MKSIKTLVFCLLIHLALVASALAQTEVLTVQGNLPRYNYRDNTGQLIWTLAGNGVLWKLDGPIHSGVVIATSAAPSNSLILNEGGVSIRGTGFPAAKLHVGSINDATQPGEVKIDPGNAAATAAILVQNQSLDAELRLVTQAATKQSTLRLVSPNGHFATSVAGGSGRYTIRDAKNAVTPVTIFPGVLNQNTLVLRDGRVGIGVINPTSPIQLANGASCSAGGVWINASSRELKQDIRELSAAEAREAMQSLNPVTYTYKSAPEDPQVGFIAEEVPDLVATPDRKGLSSMEVVAVLTKVVKQQQQVLEQQQEQLQRQADQLAAIQAELKAIQQK